MGRTKRSRVSDDECEPLIKQSKKTNKSSEKGKKKTSKYEISEDESPLIKIEHDTTDAVKLETEVKVEDTKQGISTEACSSNSSDLVPDRVLIQGYKVISEIAELNTLSKEIISRAQDLFKDVVNDKSLKGRTQDAISVGCVYVACKQHNNAVTFKEICDKVKVSKKEVGRCYKLLSKKLDQTIETTTTADYMQKFCEKLNLPPVLERAALFIADNAINNDLVPGRSPISVAAAAIFMACAASNHPKTQKEIANAVGCSDVTIRQAYKLIYPEAESLFPQDFVFVTPFDQLPLA